MNILWETVKATAGMVGQAAVETGMKGKLQTELLLISNEIDARKRLFGEQLYEFVEPLSKTPDFYAANDRMTETLRGPLLTAQREISALDIRRRIIIQKVTNTEQEEKGAYINATNWQETLQNTAKKAGYVSHHAKLKTEMGMVDVQIKDFKQVFGLELFAILMELEDKEGWLPTVRDIRSIYDQARRDVEKIQVRQKEKEAELIQLGGTPIVESAPTASITTSPDDPNKGTGTAGSYFKQIAAVEAQQQQQQPSVPMAQAVAVGPAVVETIRSTGGPLSYSIPAMAPTTASQQQSSYPDPFAMSTSSITTSYPPPPQQQQQQQHQQQLPPITSAPAVINPMFAYDDATKVSTTTGTLQQQQQQRQPNLDPFAAMYNTGASNNNSNTTFGAQQQQQMGGSMNMNSNSMMTFPSSISTAQQQQQPYVDPFAVSSSLSFMQQPAPMQQQSSVSSYQTDPDDPFAMLSSTSTVSQQQQQPSLSQYPHLTMNTGTAANNTNSSTTTANPLFRY